MDIRAQKIRSVQYSVGQIATLMLELLAAYGLFFMTTTKLMNPNAASSVISIASIVSVIIGLYIGYAVDKSKRGKRSIAFVGLIPALVIFCLIFLPVDFGQTGNTVYMVTVYILFYAAYYFFLTPFDALGGDIVSDYNVRTFMRTLCVAGIYVGVIFADTLSTYIRMWLMGAGMTDPVSWFVMAIILAVIAGLAGLFAFKATKGYGGPVENKVEAPKQNIVKAYWNILKVKPVTIIIIWTVLYYVVNMIMSPMILYYGVYVLGMTQAAASTLYMVAVAVVLIFTPFAPMISKKAGKKGTIYIATIVYAVFAVYAVVCDPKGFVAGAIFAGVYSIVNTLAQSCGYSMLYDATEVAEFKTGEAQETSAMGLMKCAMGIGVAGGTSLLGQILVIGGFDGAALVQSAHAVNWITYGVTYIPLAILIISSLVIAVGYKINEKNHAALVKALEAKRAGEEYTTEGFEELL